MRRFLFFIGGGFLILGAVFAFAQTRRDDALIVTSKDFSDSIKGKVLSAQTEVPVNKPSLPVRLKINKRLVYLYYPQKITVTTAPGAELRVKVTYPNGSINNNGTTTGVADDAGHFIVKWDIKGKDIYGITTVDVTAIAGNKQGQTKGQFEITGYGRKKTQSSTNNSDSFSSSN